jgi:hypothetical protein
MDKLIMTAATIVAASAARYCGAAVVSAAPTMITLVVGCGADECDHPADEVITLDWSTGSLVMIGYSGATLITADNLYLIDSAIITYMEGPN